MRLIILGEATVPHTRRWVRYFVQQGHECLWLSFVGADPVGDIAPRKLPLPLSHRGASIPFVARKLKKTFEEWCPDVVCALFIPDYGWLASLIDIHPLIVAAWGSDVLLNPEKSAWHRRRIQRVLRTADHLFGDAHCIADAMIDLGANPDSISTIPLGVDREWLNWARDTKDASTPIHILHNRQLKPIYRPEDVIAAIQLLEQQCPGRFCLDVVGRGPMRESLMGKASSLTEQGIVQFHPFLPAEELRRQFAKSDLYVSASESDGTSVSLLEAMVSGCLPIISDIPANREWVEHGVNGYIFPVGDARRLAECCVEAVQDSNARDDMAQRNHALINERARFEDNMCEVETVLKRMISL